MKTAVFVQFVDNPPDTYPPFWLIGIRPFGLQSSPIEVKTHMTRDAAQQDYLSRLSRI